MNAHLSFLSFVFFFFWYFSINFFSFFLCLFYLSFLSPKMNLLSKQKVQFDLLPFLANFGRRYFLLERSNLSFHLIFYSEESKLRKTEFEIKYSVIFQSNFVIQTIIVLMEKRFMRRHCCEYFPVWTLKVTRFRSNAFFHKMFLVLQSWMSERTTICLLWNGQTMFSNVFGKIFENKFSPFLFM